MTLIPNLAGIPQSGGSPGTPGDEFDGPTYQDDTSSKVRHTETPQQPPPGIDIHAPKYGNPLYDIRPAAIEEAMFRHSGWAGNRQKVFEAFNRTGRSSKRIDRFCECGAALYAELDTADNSIHFTSTHCHDRCCVPCQKARAFAITQAILPQIKTHTCRFLTLTLKHPNEPLPDLFDKLYTCFAKMRRTKEFKDHATGGGCFLECKVNLKTDQWHPHLHIILQGTWWDVYDISRLWRKVTVDSSYVWMSAIATEEKLAAYVTKYCTKPVDQTIYRRPDKLDEFIIAIAGRRLALTFGCWRSIKLNPKVPLLATRKKLGLVTDIARRAAEGDTTATRLWEAICRKSPPIADIFKRPPPDDNPFPY